MKPKEKERLVKCRPTLLQSLEVDVILPALVKEGIYDKKDEKQIRSESRKTKRIVHFLDIMEKKRSEGYQTFLDILQQYDPPLFLMLTEEEFEGNPTDLHYSLSDEMNMFQQAREFLVQEIDAEKLLPHINRPDLISDSEKRSIVKEKDVTKRTETFLDILESRGPAAFDVVLEAIGETYPHVYLALSEDNRLDDLDW